jgi:hypothetical protein
MTAPYLKKPSIFTDELKLSEIVRREFAPNPSLSAYELLRPTIPLTVEFLRPESLPRIGNCGVLRNNSAFGCNYLDSAGRETKLGVNFDTYPGGLGFSLKFFLGSR